LTFALKCHNDFIEIEIRRFHDTLYGAADDGNSVASDDLEPKHIFDEHTVEWAVKVAGGMDVADLIAHDSGLTLVRKVRAVTVSYRSTITLNYLKTKKIFLTLTLTLAHSTRLMKHSSTIANKSKKTVEQNSKTHSTPAVFLCFLSRYKSATACMV
jgi:hypothetical protein